MKTSLLSVLCASLMLFSVALQAAAPSATAAEKLGEMVAQNPLNGATIGIYVVDAQSSQVLVNINGEKPMKPASCNKLLTTAAGLTLLGAQSHFSTDLLYDGQIQGDTLSGDLMIKGGGDPSISGRFQKDKKDVTFTLRQWAEDLKTSGVRRVTGNIIADDTFFDRQYFHPNWYGEERGEWYEAEVSGLAFNDNCVDMTWCAQDCLPSEPAMVVLNPPTSYVNFSNKVTVIARGRTAEREYKREATSNDILATGTLMVDTLKEDSAAVSNGPLYFATVFKEVLTSAGIEVAGKPVLVDAAKAPEISRRARLFAHHSSPELSELVKVINLYSQNFFADCLCKSIGRLKRGEGSWAAGTSAVMEFCRKSGIYCEGHQMVDGSGLSGRNRVSPRQLVEMIRLMDKGQLHEAWRASFPIGGTRGTLKARFQQTSESRTLAPRILGKTGLIGGVRSLSGIVKDSRGRDLYYSIILNDLNVSSEKAIDFIDAVAVELAKLK